MRVVSFGIFRELIIYGGNQGDVSSRGSSRIGMEKTTITVISSRLRIGHIKCTRSGAVGHIKTKLFGIAHGNDVSNVIWAELHQAIVA
jgi:hypothetical protein